MKLNQGLKKLNFSEEEIARLTPMLDKYIKEIALFNSAYNLTNTSDYDEIVVNHILDSLSAVPKIKELCESIRNTTNEEILIGDIGSGGGLPGIPLSCALPEYNFTLVERMDKRCAFLEGEIAILGLTNAKVLQSEAEKVPEGSFHIATFRAFRPLDKKMTKTLLRLTKNNGYLAAYKAKKSSIEEEMSLISKIVSHYDTYSLMVPYLTDTGDKSERERNLVTIKKV